MYMYMQVPDGLTTSFVVKLLQKTFCSGGWHMQVYTVFWHCNTSNKAKLLNLKALLLCPISIKEFLGVESKTKLESLTGTFKT